MTKIFNTFIDLFGIENIPWRELGIAIAIDCDKKRKSDPSCDEVLMEIRHIYPSRKHPDGTHYNDVQMAFEHDSVLRLVKNGFRSIEKEPVDSL